MEFLSERIPKNGGNKRALIFSSVNNSMNLGKRRRTSRGDSPVVDTLSLNTTFHEAEAVSSLGDSPLFPLSFLTSPPNTAEGLLDGFKKKSIAGLSFLLKPTQVSGG